MKKQNNNLADVALVAAAVSAATAGAIVALERAIRSEKGQAAVATVRTKANEVKTNVQAKAAQVKTNVQAKAAEVKAKFAKAPAEARLRPRMATLRKPLRKLRLWRQTRHPPLSKHAYICQAGEGRHMTHGDARCTAHHISCA